jgi:hypothetical protein
MGYFKRHHTHVIKFTDSIFSDFAVISYVFLIKFYVSIIQLAKYN